MTDLGSPGDRTQGCSPAGMAVYRPLSSGRWPVSRSRLTAAPLAHRGQDSGLVGRLRPSQTPGQARMSRRSDGARLHRSVRRRSSQLRGPTPMPGNGSAVGGDSGPGGKCRFRAAIGLAKLSPDRVLVGGYPTLQQAHHTDGPVHGEEGARSGNRAARAPHALVLAEVRARRDVDVGGQGPVENAGCLTGTM